MGISGDEGLISKMFPMISQEVTIAFINSLLDGGIFNSMKEIFGVYVSTIFLSF